MSHTLKYNEVDIWNINTLIKDIYSTNNINVSISASLTYLYFKVPMSSQLPEAIKIFGVT